MLMIRLSRVGARKQPYYRVVVIEKERARNGRPVGPEGMRPRPVERIARHEGRRGKGVVEVVHDDGRFNNDVSVVDKRRHHAVRVEL